MTVSTIITAMIFLSFVSAVGGLVLGLFLEREELDLDTRVVLSLLGNAVGIIAALFISFNLQMTLISYEVAGLVMSLGFLVGFLGIGLLIGPRTRS